MSLTSRQTGVGGIRTRRARHSRRRFLGDLAAGAAAATGFGRDISSAAQGLSGSLRIGYEGANTVVAPFIESTVEAVRAANPGVEIAVEPSPGGDYITQLAIQLFSGNAPDVFLLLGLGAGELSSGGLIMPLDDYVANWEAWPEYGPDARFGVTVQDSVWAIPYALDTYFLFYRKDQFEQAGLPHEWQPTHPDDILAAALAVKAAVPETIPYALYAGANGGNGTAGSFLTLITAYGGSLTNEEGLWYINSCPIQEALAYYDRAYQVDQTVPQTVMTDVAPLESMPAAIGDGSLSMLYEHARNYRTWVEADPENEDQIGYALFPKAAEGEGFALSGAGDCWFINSACENPDLAWAFIESFNSVENQVGLALADPHIPAREQAALDPALSATPFLTAMLDTSERLVVPPAEPGFRNLIGIVQNATGLVATGEATPEEAVERYAEELTRTLGEDRVVSEPCR